VHTSFGSERQSGAKGRPVEFDMARRLGVTVVEVEGLPVDASYIVDLNLVVVRAGLDHATREWCADWLLPEVCAAPSPSTAKPSPRAP
jgi:hypothetical protein